MNKISAAALFLTVLIEGNKLETNAGVTFHDLTGEVSSKGTGASCLNVEQVPFLFKDASGVPLNGKCYMDHDCSGDRTCDKSKNCCTGQSNCDNVLPKPDAPCEL